MASGKDRDEADEMLEEYIYDYLVKRKLHRSAEAFAKVANVGNNPDVIDTPHGFLYEWWAMSWDLYFSKLATHPEAMEITSVKPTQMMESEQTNVCQGVPNTNMNQQRAEQLPVSMNFDKMPGQTEASLLVSKMHDRDHSGLPARAFDPNLQQIDFDKVTISKPPSSHASRFLQQIPQKAQQRTARVKSSGGNLGRTSRTASTLCGLPKAVLPRAGLHDPGLEKGANPLLMKGWPLTGFGQIASSMSFPVLNSLFPLPNQQQQFQTSMDHHQDLFARVVATARKQESTFQGSANNLGNMLPSNDMHGKDGQVMAPVGQTAEQQMPVPTEQTAGQQMPVPTGQTTEQKTFVPGAQTAEEQQKDQLTPEELHENRSKRKKLSNSPAEENALDGKDAEVEKPSNDDIESFSSHDDGNADNMGTPLGNLQQSSTPCGIKAHNGFSFEEVGSVNTSKGKLLCCHFSSDGKFVASAGHEKKVLLWSTSTFDYVDTAEGHSDFITDVRFKASSSIFASCSFDRTVQLWDANKPSKSIAKLFGHAEQVTSLDFHPRKVDLLCSCDSSEEIRLWNISQYACTSIFKGATRQVRFQPRVGNLLAAASGNRIGLFDVETNNLQCYLEGHVKEVRSICWETSGRYLASVSEDSARVWSVLLGGKCVHELHSTGNKFESCTFHPRYALILAIGSHKSLDLWNPVERNSKPMTVTAAHNDTISALADCSETQMIASASHDRCVKLWK